MISVVFNVTVINLIYLTSTHSDANVRILQWRQSHHHHLHQHHHHRTSSGYAMKAKQNRTDKKHSSIHTHTYFNNTIRCSLWRETNSSAAFWLFHCTILYLKWEQFNICCQSLCLFSFVYLASRLYNLRRHRKRFAVEKNEKRKQEKRRKQENNNEWLFVGSLVRSFVLWLAGSSGRLKMRILCVSASCMCLSYHIISKGYPNDARFSACAYPRIKHRTDGVDLFEFNPKKCNVK